MKQWKQASYAIALISTITTIIFMKWGNCQLRRWNKPKQRKVKPKYPKELIGPQPPMCIRRSSAVPEDEGPPRKSSIEQSTSHTSKNQDEETTPDVKSGLSIAHIAKMKSLYKKAKWRLQTDPETREQRWVIDYKGESLNKPAIERESSVMRVEELVSSVSEQDPSQFSLKSKGESSIKMCSTTSLTKLSKSGSHLGRPRWRLEVDSETHEQYWVVDLAPEGVASKQVTSFSPMRVAKDKSNMEIPSWRLINQNKEYGIIELTSDGKVPTTRGDMPISAISMHSLRLIAKTMSPPVTSYDSSDNSRGKAKHTYDVVSAVDIKERTKRDRPLSILFDSPSNSKQTTNRRTGKYHIKMENSSLKEENSTSSESEEYGIIELSPDGKVLKVKPKPNFPPMSKSPPHFSETLGRTGLKKKRKRAKVTWKKEEFETSSSEGEFEKIESSKPNEKGKHYRSESFKSKKSSKQKKENLFTRIEEDVLIENIKQQTEEGIPSVKQKHPHLKQGKRSKRGIASYPSTHIIQSRSQIIIPRIKEDQTEGIDKRGEYKLGESTQKASKAKRKSALSKQSQPPHKKSRKKEASLKTKNESEGETEVITIVKEKIVDHPDPKYDEFGIVEIPPDAKRVKVIRGHSGVKRHHGRLV